jgi:hypothetical protein
MKLPQITLVAITGLNYKTQEHLKALELSQKGLEFGDVKLLQLDSIKDIDSWNKAIIYELPKYIETDFVILIHADGYIIHPELWTEEWLQYDYIGAPWPLPRDNFSYRDTSGVIQRVGNSVSLRSKRLIDLAPKLNLEWKSFHGFTNEDGFICVNYRHEYEKAGMKFAPLEVAKYFSKEHTIPENKDLQTFAFHSL